MMSLSEVLSIEEVKNVFFFYSVLLYLKHQIILLQLFNLKFAIWIFIINTQFILILYKISFLLFLTISSY